MTDLIAANFGLLELLLFVELVIVFTAAAFYGIARVAARGSRHDPMVRFYYVFWRGFFADVTPVGVMVARHAEAVARAKGRTTIDDPDPELLAVPDGPDLAALTGDDLTGHAIAAPTPAYAPPPPTQSGREPTSPAAPAADATLDVRMVGRSAADTVAGHEGRTLVVHVRNEVEDGQANGVIVRLVAELLGVPVYRIVLLRGHYKSDKAFKIVGVDQATVDARINEA